MKTKIIDNNRIFNIEPQLHLVNNFKLQIASSGTQMLHLEYSISGYNIVV